MEVFDADKFLKELKFPEGLKQGRPLYWKHELTGKMARIVNKFLHGEKLNSDELTVLRWYVFQWVNAFPFKPEDYRRVLSMSQEEIKSYSFDVLVSEYAIDPF